MANRPGEKPAAVLAQYILECRGRGAFLSYEEYDIVATWAKLCPDTDQLLLTLADAFDADNSATLTKTSAKNLKFYQKAVSRRLSEYKASKT